MEGECALRVSPDRNWVIYQMLTGVLYLGDLGNSRVQLYAYAACPNFWSPDSRHFIYTEEPSGDFFLGAIDKPPVSIGRMSILGWIDSKHYIHTAYLAPAEGESKILVAEINGDTIVNYLTQISLPKDSTEITFIMIDK
jgi:hypothetical protein